MQRDAASNRIQVLVRLRPLNGTEKAEGARPPAPPPTAPCNAPVRDGLPLAQLAQPPRRRPSCPGRHAGTLPVVTSNTATRELTVVRGAGKAQHRSTFRYDKVFGSFATQEEVFDSIMSGEAQA